MKYKVFLLTGNTVPTSSTAGATFTFYRKQEAINCANTWYESSAGNHAWLWDGSSWTLFT